MRLTHPALHSSLPCIGVPRARWSSCVPACALHKWRALLCLRAITPCASPRHVRHHTLLCVTSRASQAGMKSPMDYIQETEPIKVSGMVVASYGSE